MVYISLKADRGNVPYFGDLIRRLNDFIDSNPSPFTQSDIDILLIPSSKNIGNRYLYQIEENSVESKTKVVDSVAFSLWRAKLDCWFKDNFPLPNFERGIQTLGVVIKFINPKSIQEIEQCGQDSRKKTSKLIKGQDLATFTAVQPKFKMSDLIVTDELRNNIITTVGILKNRVLIYETWGFNEVDSNARAVLNFYGPPGTGKTMAAHAIANELEMKILIANFAEIESKYVGDSPKNLENIFTVAMAENAVLFFDEADSFLGKRLTSISNSSDQAVNSLRSKLLQLLEDYNGIVIFCTNLIKNYDQAFESRILRSLEFKLPDKAARIRLINQKIPQKVPFETGKRPVQEELAMLADISDGFSGREIKNAILQTLCNVAVREKKLFTINDFKEAFAQKKKELEALRLSRGDIDSEKKKTLETKIHAQLSTGNYAEGKSGKLKG